MDTAWCWQLRLSFAASEHRINFANLRLARLASYDLVVALNIVDLRYLARQQKQLAGNPIPIPSVAAINLCHDKLTFNQYVANGPFGAMIPPLGRPAIFPYIVKKREDAWARNCHLVKNREDERRVDALIHDNDYFMQTFIPGAEEYATHLVMRNKKIVTALNIKHVFSTTTPIKGRSVKLRTELVQSEYLSQFAQILNDIGFSGLCCVNYKVQGNKPYIFEINPRFDSSLGRHFSTFLKYI